MKEILNFSYCPATCDNLTETELCSTVQQYLREKTFLLVFQDLSIKNLYNCSLFTSLLGMQKRGSKIMVTTQNEDIADAIEQPKVYMVEVQSQQNQSRTALVRDIEETSNVYNADESVQANPPGKQDPFITNQTIFKVERLSEADSIPLFEDYASRDKDEAFKRKAKEHVKKCNGVPLAIKCMGAMLSLETSVPEFEWMEDNKQQESEEQDEDCRILSILDYAMIECPHS